MIRNIAFQNVVLTNTTGVGLFLAGLPESPLQRVSFERVRVHAKTGAEIVNVGQLTMLDTVVLPLP